LLHFAAARIAAHGSGSGVAPVPFWISITSPGDMGRPGR
jgi:hypothetical protein